MAEAIAKYLPLDIVKLNFEPDGNFPNGVPNPFLPENREATSKAGVENHDDLGVAWDGDSDRCFLFDEKGNFAEDYYIAGLLAKAFLSRDSHARIIHDPRLTWNIIEIVKSMGSTPIMSKTGHAFIKERMCREAAVYGGEMSAITTSATSSTATPECCRGCSWQSRSVKAARRSPRCPRSPSAATRSQGD